MLAPSPLQPLDHPAVAAAGVRLFCKRDDAYAFDPGSPLQGNKIRKLWPLLRDTDRLRGRTVFSFGGAYSNHLAALAAAGQRFGFATRLYVRGEDVENPTLNFLRRTGSELHFVSRSDYRRRTDPAYLASLPNQPDDILLPEGGGTPEALPYAGAVFTEAVGQLGYAPDVFCLSAGTGCTAAGILNAAAGAVTTVEVYPALRGNWMRSALLAWLPESVREDQFDIVSDYTYGGYAKFPGHWRLHTPPGQLAKRADIGIGGLPPLEPVYTAKLFAGVMDRIERGIYPRGTTLIVLHTGGLY